MAYSAEKLTETLSDPTRWTAPGSVPGDFVLVDPLTTQQLNPNEPPVWVRQDPILSTGFDFLQDRGADINCLLAYSAHEVAEDLGELSRSWYEKQVAAADYYTFEDIGSTPESNKTLLREARQLMSFCMMGGEVPTREHFLRACNDSFNARVLAARMLTGTPSFSFDIGKTGSVAEQATFAALQELGRHPDKTAVGLGHVALQNVREWCGVGKTGVMLECFERERERRNLNVFSTVGTAHRDLTRKFRTQGATAKSALIRADASRQALGHPENIAEMQQIFETGIILADDVDWLRATAKSVYSLIYSADWRS